MSQSGTAQKIKFNPCNTFIKLKGIQFNFESKNGKHLETLVKSKFEFKVGQLLSFGGNNPGIDHLYVLHVIIEDKESVLLVGEECKRQVKEPLVSQVEGKREKFIEATKSILVNGG